MSMAPRNDGFLLLDADLNLLASNDPALQILCFPSEITQMQHPKILVADRVRSTLLEHHPRDRKVFVREMRSGRRRYLCKSFQVNCNGHSWPQPAIAVVLERPATGGLNSAELYERFGLTQRECETVEYLLQGFTSKEIAARMNISPNTVRAFLRLVMVKMGVTTRSGIVAKILQDRHDNGKVVRLSAESELAV